MQDVETEQKSYGFFERILYLFVIPMMFTALLMVVLLSIFDYDIMNSVLKAANKVPVLEKVIPDPLQDEAESQSSEYINETFSIDPAHDELQKLSVKLEEKEADIQILSQELERKNTVVESLSKQLEELQAEQQQQMISEEEYRSNIKHVANIYADMLPSRSAAIMQNLTLAERVLVLSEMKRADQVRVLEKMPASVAAETSILLKDEQLVNDQQIQALQERLHELTRAEDATEDS